MNLDEQLGKNIQRLRKGKRLSQEYLANQIGMSPAYLRSIEHGTANPTLHAIVRIADCLETSVVALLSVDEQI